MPLYPTSGLYALESGGNFIPLSYLVKTVNSSSTDTQVPTAKAVYTFVNGEYVPLSSVITEISSESKDTEIPTAKAVYDFVITISKQALKATVELNNLSHSINKASSPTLFPVSFNRNTGADDYWKGGGASYFTYVGDHAYTAQVDSVVTLVNGMSQDTEGEITISTSSGDVFVKPYYCSAGATTVIAITGTIQIKVGDTLNVKYTSSYDGSLDGKYLRVETLSLSVTTDIYTEADIIPSPGGFADLFSQYSWWAGETRESNKYSCTGSDIGISAVARGYISAALDLGQESNSVDGVVYFVFTPVVDTTVTETQTIYYGQLNSQNVFSGWRHPTLTKLP